MTRTLRLDEDVEAGIVEMAEREQFSFNLLANRALRKLVEWEDKASKFGFIQVPTSLVEKVFSILSDEEARELGREAGTNTLPEMVLFWFKKFNPENALKAMEMIGSYGNAFRLQYTLDGETDTVVLKHDRGPRVSGTLFAVAHLTCPPLVRPNRSAGFAGRFPRHWGGRRLASRHFVAHFAPFPKVRPDEPDV